MAQDCIFCKIAAKEIPAAIIYEDDLVLAFSDINPAAPFHALVIPKVHIANLLEVESINMEIMTHMLTVVQKVVREFDVADKGFRVVINTKEDGGQTVNHLHIHILGGRFLDWPPG